MKCYIFTSCWARTRTLLCGDKLVFLSFVCYLITMSCMVSTCVTNSIAHCFFFFFWPYHAARGSSLTRDWTRALSSEAQSPNHWTTRAFPQLRTFIWTSRHVQIEFPLKKRSSELPPSWSLKHFIISSNIYLTELSGKAFFLKSGQKQGNLST